MRHLWRPYSPRVIKDSLTHNLRVGCAHLIVDDFQTREKIYEDVNDFYKLRSAIVHGGKTEARDELG